MGLIDVDIKGAFDFDGRFGVIFLSGEGEQCLIFFGAGDFCGVKKRLVDLFLDLYRVRFGFFLMTSFLFVVPAQKWKQIFMY